MNTNFLETLITRNSANMPHISQEAQKELEEMKSRLRWWLETYDITMPCGHKNRYSAESENGTQYCVMCKIDETQQTIDDLQEHLS